MSDNVRGRRGLIRRVEDDLSCPLAGLSSLVAVSTPAFHPALSLQPRPILGPRKRIIVQAGKNGDPCAVNQGKRQEEGEAEELARGQSGAGEPAQAMLVSSAPTSRVRALSAAGCSRTDAVKVAFARAVNSRLPPPPCSL